MFFDKAGVIQDQNNILVLYHWKRNRANKRIALKHDSLIINRSNFKFSMALPTRDIIDFRRLEEKYWWLADDTRHILELRDRKRRWFEALAREVQNNRES